MRERIDARRAHVRIGREVDRGREERARITTLVPADTVEVRIGVRMRVPDVVILRIVEQVVDQHVAVVVVHRAVGEPEHLDAGQHRVARRGIDDDAVARMAHRRVDEAEAERHAVDTAAAVERLVAADRGEIIVAARGRARSRRRSGSRAARRAASSVLPPPKLNTVSGPTCVASASTSANELKPNPGRLMRSSLPRPARSRRSCRRRSPPRRRSGRRPRRR